MGRATTSSPSDQPPATTHFSHHHPLHLAHNLPNAYCSACKQDASGSAVYTCIPCNFILHPKCYELPQQITHSCHNMHTLLLHPKPAYPHGVFLCDACGNKGDGFSYRCGPCGVDLHTICSVLPLELTHQCHHHKLSLTFAVPYSSNSFSCDICMSVGSNTWIYRCNLCEFDVHLTCVANIVPVAPVQPLNWMNSQSYMGPSYGQNHVLPRGNPHAGVVQMNPVPGVRPINQVNGGVAGGIARGVAGRIASWVAQTAAQTLLEAVIGGDSDGDDVISYCDSDAEDDSY